jgi:hypothetical protein
MRSDGPEGPANSVADPDPDQGSSAFLTPRSGIGIGFFLNPGSRIPNHIIDSLMTIVWVKSFITLCKLAQIFLFQFQKNFKKVLNICSYKQGRTKKIFTLLLCCCS